MKKAINLLMLLLLYVVAASAQKYDVKCLRGDSVAVYDVVETIRSEETPVELSCISGEIAAIREPEKLIDTR